MKILNDGKSEEYHIDYFRGIRGFDQKETYARHLYAPKAEPAALFLCSGRSFPHTLHGRGLSFFRKEKSVRLYETGGSRQHGIFG